ncbi:ATPase with chaperone activity [Ideonella sp.]|uniref:ATPase with chaperone activity n=1 Tax=Ideonella sp. TaxID=1929293 RepID=UPI002B498E2E|nr:ATPase with chaperone activity [Ideonella sp.]HJV70745.1 ATPase with chaperone activity [Ideonella sp.]
MTEDTPPVLPPSFMALFAEAGRLKPNQPREFIQQRYGFCEDLANLLVDTARAKHWELQVTQADVLARIHAGLVAGAIEITEPEAAWVGRRLAELLGWEDFLPPAPA